MKIVLSGTDSLGFLFTEDEQLYDRCILLHTTFIPYREFESVLGVHGIDEYIRYGGTMSLGGVHYNETSTFASKESTDEYVAPPSPATSSTPCAAISMRGISVICGICTTRMS